MNDGLRNKRDVEGGETDVQNDELMYCLMHFPLDERCLISVELTLREMMLV